MAMLLFLTSLILSASGEQRPVLQPIEFCDNYHGASWTHESVQPGQIFSIRYHLVHSLALGKEFEVEMIFSDSQGKQVMHASKTVTQLVTGGQTDFWSFVNLVVPAAEPGTYQLTIRISSKTNTLKLEASRKLILEPIKLAFYVCSLTHDVQGQAAASPRHLLLFQPVTVRLGICGLKVMDAKIQVRATRQLLSSAGKVLDELVMPDHQEIALLVPGQTTGSTQVTFHTTVHQPGEYRLKFIIEDLQTREQIIKEIPVRFMAPDTP